MHERQPALDSTELLHRISRLSSEAPWTTDELRDALREGGVDPARLVGRSAARPAVTRAPLPVCHGSLTGYAIRGGGGQGVRRYSGPLEYEPRGPAMLAGARAGYGTMRALQQARGRARACRNAVGAAP